MARHCSRCGLPGHYASTCRGMAGKPSTSPSPVGAAIGGTVASAGTVESADLEPAKAPPSLKPRCGLWIFSPKYQNILGKISQIRSNGEVVWENKWGIISSELQEVLVARDYIWGDLEPKMLQWLINKH